MLHTTVKPHEHHSALEPTHPAGPSPDETTHTSDTLGTITAQPSPVAPAVGELRQRERYQILGEHGRGGLGRVSRVHDRDLGRDIAIKELISRDHLREMRFLREALITARLEHPGIVPVYEAGRWPDGTPFYAMKLVAGRSLRDLLAERQTTEQRIKLLHHVIAVAEAIAYAHDRNIIHRDLKPANVIIGDFGETIVIDWGLAKDLTAAEDSVINVGPFRSRGDDGLTSTGSVLGTPAYMAPEQRRGNPVDQRADVHAIGAMLWELCTSQKLPPGYAGQRRSMLRRAGIDSDLVSIIEKSLDPDPARRYPHAGALASDLKAFKAGARISARRYSLLAMLAHWMKRHRALALSVITGIAVVSASLIMYMRRIAAERDRVAAANSALVLEKHCCCEPTRQPPSMRSGTMTARIRRVFSCFAPKRSVLGSRTCAQYRTRRSRASCSPSATMRSSRSATAMSPRPRSMGPVESSRRAIRGGIWSPTHPRVTCLRLPVRRPRSACLTSGRSARFSRHSRSP
jgi:hypothetical protein